MTTDLRHKVITIDNRDRLSGGNAYEFDIELDERLRNVSMVRLESMVMPMLRNEVYVIVSIKELGVEFPVMFDSRYWTQRPNYEFPLLVRPEVHYKEHTTPIASVRRLHVKVHLFDGEVVRPDMSYTHTSNQLFLSLSLTYDPMVEVMPLANSYHLATQRRLFMYDFRFAHSDLVNFDFNFEVDQVEAIRNVASLRLIDAYCPHVYETDVVPTFGTLVAPGEESHIVVKIPHFGIEWPLHFNFWHTTEDIVPLRVTEAHEQAFDPPEQQINKWNVKVCRPNGSVLTKFYTRDKFGLYLLFEIVYHPKR